MGANRAGKLAMSKAEVPVSSPRSTAAGAASTASVAVNSTHAGHPVIFFDGVCGLCNRFVDFVIRRDRQGVFRLAPLQGETARDRLAAADVRDLKTVVLVDPSGTYRKSTAVLRVLGRLGGSSGKSRRPCCGSFPARYAIWDTPGLPPTVMRYSAGKRPVGCRVPPNANGSCPEPIWDTRSNGPPD